MDWKKFKQFIDKNFTIGEQQKLPLLTAMVLYGDYLKVKGATDGDVTISKCHL